MWIGFATAGHKLRGLAHGPNFGENAQLARSFTNTNRIEIPRARLNLYLSKAAENKGGGANSFVWNFVAWARRYRHRVVSDPRGADRAIVIAHWSEAERLEEAHRKGCRIVHRIDEYFQKEESGYRKEKHERIRSLNRHADVTVFQSEFVRKNALPFLQPRRHVVIRNGAEPRLFHPGRRAGSCVGHVTWSADPRKGLDTLYRKIRETPEETFLLVGRHAESAEDFGGLPNAIIRGARTRRQMAREYRKMKVLYFPSQDEPCPNIPIEAVLSGVPVCFHDSGGTPEIIRNCGLPLDRFDELIRDPAKYRNRCLDRADLHFDAVARRYIEV